MVTIYNIIQIVSIIIAFSSITNAFTNSETVNCVLLIIGIIGYYITFELIARYYNTLESEIKKIRFRLDELERENNA